jgi:predicted ribosomally synthesized peptide with SipW-like signal peptide
MKKIIGLILALMLVIGLACAGAYAYFVDTESSTGNELRAGTLDLTTDGGNGVSQTLFNTSLAPGDTVGLETIGLTNAGSIDGTSLTISFSYTENDGPRNVVPMTADQTAGQLHVTTLEYAGSSLIGTILDANQNQVPDLFDLMVSGLSLTGIAAGNTEDFVIGVTFNEDASNDYQSDGINLTITFYLNQ